MLKSLFSGVTGLQSHQIAMDVESNNIANVNTIGFKYARANFSNLLAQTGKIATAPQGDLGGKNALQVGLGTSIDSVTRIHSQGSIQNTDKNTDVAIQGDGFFIVSSDGGNTYKYSRSGDFKFDALGNFVDNNGFVVQGWSRDETTGQVDSTAPISNIQIPPGLTTPAQMTTEINLKANLNSGPLVEQFSAAYAMDSTGAYIADNGTLLDPAIAPRDEDMGIMFNATGESLALKDGQGSWFSYMPSDTGAVAIGALGAIDLDLNGTNITGTAANASELANLINQKNHLTGITAIPDDAGGSVQLINDNTTGTTGAQKNITIADNNGNTGLAGNDQKTAYFYAYNSNNISYPSADGTYRTLAELRALVAADVVTHSAGAEVSVTQEGELYIDNIAGSDLSITSTAATDINTTSNIFLNEVLAPLSRNIPVGGSGASQPINHATHASSIDIFDSLGSKHTIRIDFIKAADQEWRYIITAPSTATIDGATQPENILEYPSQTVNFDENGALITSDINFSFTANNGSMADQSITIDIGTFGSFDGLTSFDRPSATSGISQDGFPGGDLVGIRIDQSGTLVGSFTNGRSFGLAQISMAKFANNEGLVGDGGNVYLQSANSGDPIIGTAATAGRGFIQSSALEASNVDLSKSLTQLIIIQRGYQANGKTITTSDTLLETLIGLKR